jgi:hypothetical protein
MSAPASDRSERRIPGRAGSLRRRAWRKSVTWRGRWTRWRILHPVRKSEMQRIFEAGDPDGTVRAYADQIIAGIRNEKDTAHE